MGGISDILAARRDEVIHRWAADLEQSEAALGLTREEVVGSLDELLDALQRRLAGASDGDGANGARHEAILERHVGCRLRQGFSLDDTLAEYTLLGRHLVEVCVGAGAACADELSRVFREIDAVQARVVKLYTRHLLEDEQADKRYLRLLDQAAAETLGGRAFVQRLGELVELIVRGLAGACGFLFLSAEDGTVALAATAGARCLDVATWAPIRLEQAPLLRAVYAAREPVSIADVARVDSAIVPRLNHTTPHALAAVALGAGDAPLGALAVGYHAVQEIPSRLERRLGALGRRFTLHLQAGRLCEALHAERRRLEEERVLRDRFVSALAHDLRGPLAAARATTQLILRHETGRVTHLASRVVQALDRTDRMIRDLLDVSRIRAGERLPVKLERCDLAAVAREIIDELAAVHGDRFHLVADEPLEGWWSRRDLGRAIWNLAANAVTYGAAGAPVTIVLRRAGRRVEVRVHNEGRPIDAEARRNLFRPFARFGDPAAHGWGLGLTLVRGVVEAHGGDLAVESEADRGTDFVLSLPLDARPHQAT